MKVQQKSPEKPKPAAVETRSVAEFLQRQAVSQAASSNTEILQSKDEPKTTAAETGSVAEYLRRQRASQAEVSKAEVPDKKSAAAAGSLADHLKRQMTSQTEGSKAKNQKSLGKPYGSAAAVNPARKEDHLQRQKAAASLSAVAPETKGEPLLAASRSAAPKAAPKAVPKAAAPTVAVKEGVGPTATSPEVFQSRPEFLALQPQTPAAGLQEGKEALIDDTANFDRARLERWLAANNLAGTELTWKSREKAPLLMKKQMDWQVGNALGRGTGTGGSRDVVWVAATPCP